MESKRTPLFSSCIDKGARMVNFAGWEMPIQFSSLINEHNAVRTKAGVFDISHMGVLLIKGINPKDYLQKLVPSDLHRFGPGEATYTVLLNKNGGILDDLIIYDLGIDGEGNESLLTVINAACFEEDFAWLKSNLTHENLKIANTKQDGVLLALQGPESKKELGMILGESFVDIPRFAHRTIQIQLKSDNKVEQLFIARTGYTGEDGYEILLTKEAGIIVWEELINNGVEPCGLGARDTLRLEAGMPLYGNDIDKTTTPLEAGLGWLVHLEKTTEFIGKSALINQNENGIKKKLVALKLLEKGIARKGYQIIHQNNTVGEITSGSWSPTFQKGIALAYLPIELSEPGTEISIKIREKLHKAAVVKKPFYRRVS